MMQWIPLQRGGGGIIRFVILAFAQDDSDVGLERNGRCKEMRGKTMKRKKDGR